MNVAAETWTFAERRAELPRIMEAALRERLLAGDGQALAEVYDRFANIVYGIALRVTGDRTQAEDVTQETFVCLWERPGAFDPDRGSLRTWLCTIAHRRAIDGLRRNASQQRRVERQAQEMIVTVESTGEEVSDRPEILDALEELPDEQATAIRLAYFGGKTYCEVATLLQIPEGTAKSRIRMGLQRLSELLEKHVESEAWL